MLNKAKILELMKSNSICGEDDAREAVDFVRELIEAYVEDLEENEAYATNTINRMKEANQTLGSILDGLDD